MLEWFAKTPSFPGAMQIVRRLHEFGHQALFAGGCVRDALLLVSPHDIDIATDATPKEMADLFPENITPVGAQFGVSLVVLDGTPHEVVTFRRDGRYLDGRHPQAITFSTPEEDALRRDFTINGMFYDPLTGQVMDYVGGQEDLRRKILRAIGDPFVRFEEDKLRLLRAVRFACHLDLTMEEGTRTAVIALAHSVGQVSAERLRDELLKIITGPGSARGLRLMEELGLLPAILPEVHAMVGVAQPPEYHPEGDVFVHTCLLFEHARERSPVLAMAMLLHDVGKPPTFTIKERIRFDNHVNVGADMTEVIGRRLKFSNDEIEQMADLVRNHLQFMHVREMRESTLKRFLRKPNFPDHLELHRLDCLASHGDLSNWSFCRKKIAALPPEAMAPPRLITGDHLLAIGFKPGPLFKEILALIEDAQLEGQITDEASALALVEREFGHRR
ncbi:MAG: CCA tRNA nucleotidyltransferase [Acidobacteria bacterium]|nr:CCA tRNA nucleotidyltransferase [Acidobacteriota bacterium]